MPKPSPMMECPAAGPYPTVYFPSDLREQTYANYDTEPWYSTADDYITHDLVETSTYLSWLAIPDAAENMHHFRLTSGNDKDMKVDKLLREVSRLRTEVEDTARRLASQRVGSSGWLCNGSFQQERSFGFAISRSEGLNWFLAHGKVNYFVQGYVTRSGGRTSVVHKVAMYDAYDWDPNDTRGFEEFSAPVLYGLHTAGLAAHYILHGTSSERTLTL